MSTFNLIVFFGTIIGVFTFGILFDRWVKKKWELWNNLFLLPFIVILAIAMTWMSDIYASGKVAMHIPHEWKEQVLMVQDIEDVSRAREQEGHSFLLVGGVAERETFRYTVINHDGSKTRDKVYAADCVMYQSSDGKQRIEEVRIVRKYKNPADEKFYMNRYDKKDVFYRVYL